MPSKRHKRYKLLLDEGVHLPQSYPELNNLHNVVHVSQVNLDGEPDGKIFTYACKHSKIVVVFNIKDFRNFVSPDKPSIIALSPNLSDEQVDLKVCKALKHLKPSEISGCIISISNFEITIKRPVYDK